MPRVAVLMPARDAARTVRAAAASILRQTERDLSVVCVDDGSTDETPAVLARLAERDRRVVVVPGPGEVPAPQRPRRTARRARAGRAGRTTPSPTSATRRAVSAQSHSAASR